MHYFRRLFSTAKPTSPPPPAPATPAFPPRPFASLPTYPLFTQVYILPALNGTLSMHPRLPVPANAAERTLIIAGFAFRKWRFQMWDLVAAEWHNGLGARVKADADSGKDSPNSKLRKWVYEKGNEVGTRRGVDAEWFFRGIPLRCLQMEFIYPQGVDLRTVKHQLNQFLQTRNESKKSLFLWTVLVFPPALFLAKFMLPIFNVVFVYLAWRIAGAWRAVTVGGRVQTLLDTGRVKFTESRAYRERLLQEVRKVEEQEKPWKWDGRGDLHDEVVIGLEKDLKMHEWVRTYRRSRLAAFVHGNYGVKASASVQRTAAGSKESIIDKTVQ
ncbi:hypothetical protein HDU79_010383 [Rhizoclosmatium sp. JEL0117]|nr:hypothetical protein HDU79_010383 [Rhizoclosmatium sp. JEL0117]